MPGHRDRDVKGKRGQFVFTGGGDEAAIARHLRHVPHLYLRYSQMAPLTMWDEINTGTNLPAEIKITAVDGDTYKLLFMAKGGGSANKSYLYQETKAVLNEASMLAFLDAKIRTLGTAACPPYHLAIVVGGTSAEIAVETAAGVRPLPRHAPRKATGSGGASGTGASRPRCSSSPAARASVPSSVASTSAMTCAIRLPRHGELPCRHRRLVLGRPPSPRQDHLRGVFLEQPGARPVPLPAGDGTCRPERRRGEHRPQPADERDPS